ncbi:hypothetical protein KIPB_005248 [Kipferlia bialata]|uniref:Uncharacterized protein n=1 Tax=Kipferlia bialata TaxID=797122 RepID=A0A9K3CV32_9EUKA|nr:hypothetical protein KIPB_005248 [Kipferlia bialata]|eukprot:g5248.t1
MEVPHSVYEQLEHVDLVSEDSACCLEDIKKYADALAPGEYISDGPLPLLPASLATVLGTASNLPGAMTHGGKDDIISRGVREHARIVDWASDLSFWAASLEEGVGQDVMFPAVLQSIQDLITDALLSFTGQALTHLWSHTLVHTALARFLAGGLGSLSRDLFVLLSSDDDTPLSFPDILAGVLEPVHALLGAVTGINELALRFPGILYGVEDHNQGPNSHLAHQPGSRPPRSPGAKDGMVDSGDFNDRPRCYGVALDVAQCPIGRPLEWVSSLRAMGDAELPQMGALLAVIGGIALAAHVASAFVNGGDGVGGSESLKQTGLGRAMEAAMWALSPTVVGIAFPCGMGRVYPDHADTPGIDLFYSQALMADSFSSNCVPDRRVLPDPTWVVTALSRTRRMVSLVAGSASRRVAQDASLLSILHTATAESHYSSPSVLEANSSLLDRLLMIGVFGGENAQQQLQSTIIRELQDAFPTASFTQAKPYLQAAVARVAFFVSAILVANTCRKQRVLRRFCRDFLDNSVDFFLKDSQGKGGQEGLAAEGGSLWLFGAVMQGMVGPFVASHATHRLLRADEAYPYVLMLATTMEVSLESLEKVVTLSAKAHEVAAKHSVPTPQGRGSGRQAGRGRGRRPIRGKSSTVKAPEDPVRALKRRAKTLPNNGLGLFYTVQSLSFRVFVDALAVSKAANTAVSSADGRVTYNRRWMPLLGIQSFPFPTHSAAVAHSQGQRARASESWAQWCEGKVAGLDRAVAACDKSLAFKQPQDQYPLFARLPRCYASGPGVDIPRISDVVSAIKASLLALKAVLSSCASLDEYDAQVVARVDTTMPYVILWK